MNSRHPAYVRSAVLEGAAALLGELGVDAAGLAEACGLDPAALDESDLPVPGAAVVAFFEAAAERSRCENFGLQLAARQDLSILGPVWTAMRSAATVLEALQALASFFVVHTSGAMVGFERMADGGGVVTYALRADVGARDRQTIELGLALLCQEMRRHCGAGWMPRAVQFAHSAPRQSASHRRWFGLNLAFAQERNAVWLDRACLQTPIDGSSRAEHVRQRTALTHRLDRAQAAAAEVELALRALMPFAECSREQVARLTGQSLRTLQRRLARLGTTFHRMRDRVRADLAMKYLLQSRLPAYQIAEMLGYSNPGAFTRAFRRQHGVAPSAVRRRADR